MNTWKNYLKWSEKQINDVRYLACSYLYEGKYDVAISFFEALTVVDPNNIYDLEALGALYLEINNNKEALNYLNKALNLKPKDPTILLNKATALLSLGYKKEGKEILAILQHVKNTKIMNKATAMLASLV